MEMGLTYIVVNESITHDKQCILLPHSLNHANQNTYACGKGLNIKRYYSSVFESSPNYQKSREAMKLTPGCDQMI